MNTSTTATLITTITALTRADSLMPIISSIEITQTMKTAGRLMSPCTSGPIGQLHRLRAAMRSSCGGRLMPKSCSSDDDVAGPTDGDRGGAHGVLEHQVPADDPGQQLAHGGVGVGVGAAGDRDHGGELAVAQAGEGAADGRHHEGQRDGRPGVLRRGDARSARTGPRR